MRTALKSGKSLKPADAIHLATTKRLPLDAVHTYDEKMKNHTGLISHPILEPATPGRFVFPLEEQAKATNGKTENKDGKVKPEPDSFVVREGRGGPAFGPTKEEAQPKEEAK